MPFSPCQEEAFKLLTQSSDNVFLTGRAGTGKSHLIREFIRTKDSKKFPVVASTGAAAVLVRGRTIHSFFGLGILQGGVEQAVEEARKNRRVLSRLKGIDGLVIDEISMVPKNVLQAAERVARMARENTRAWGGLRVIAVGDFAQLPPIDRHSPEKPWAFQDEVWDQTQFQPALLKTMIRTTDNEFLRVLNLVRLGVVNEEVEYYLNRKITSEYEIPHDVPRLYARKAPVEEHNLSKLSEIKQDLHEFPTEYTGKGGALEQIKKNAPVPEVLQIKKNALVMIRVNDPEMKYFNGSLGSVVGISEDELQIELKSGREVEISKESFSYLDADGNEAAVAKNFPISLAYATTIHKSQGATLDSMVCDLRRLWEPGQAYVALSRLRSGSGLHLLGWDRSSIKVSPEVMAFHRSLVS
ncbi:MAG: AAA family ATPase [Deltaproteobacteria bacterium]|nr:AAA family ATPase [Deltaproteobacteria bacterium]